MIRIVAPFLVILLFAQCAKEDYVIRKKRLGEVDNKTTVSDLDRIFARDSVEKYPAGEELIREYRVYDASGEPSWYLSRGLRTTR